VASVTAPETSAKQPEPKATLIAQASLLCLTGRPPGNHARDIVLVDYHGKVQQRLVANGALNLAPILSPDQRQLAYTSYREGTPSIYLRDLKNAKDERLTSRPGIALPGAWSPDGRYLALSKSENGNSDIFLYDLKRRHMRRLTTHSGIDISPSFAPDSQRLVFTSSRSGSSQIYLTDVNGRTPQRLTEEGHYNAAPVWSPQDDWIAFIGRAPEQTLELYVIRDDGTELRRVTIGGSTIEDAPTWSPDGRAILYTRVHGDIRQRRIVDLDGHHDRELPGHGKMCYSPQWVAQLSH
jgi:TolB protein